MSGCVDYHNYAYQIQQLILQPKIEKGRALHRQILQTV